MLNNLNETIQNVQKNLNQTTQIFQQRNRVVIFFFPWKLRGKQNISSLVQLLFQMAKLAQKNK